MEKAPAPLPTMEDLQQRDPETLQPGIWERAKGLAQSAKYNLYNLATAGQGYQLTEFQKTNRQRLLNLQERLKGKKVLGAAGAVAVGMASVFVASPATAATLTNAANKVSGGIEGFDASSVDLAGPDAFADTLDAVQDMTIGNDEHDADPTHHAGKVENESEQPKSYLAPAEQSKADVIDELADQLGLEQGEDGNFQTHGLGEYGDAKEGELYKSGTAYNEVEHIMRSMGYTTEDIQKLDESGEYHDIVRQLLHENNITYADEAQGHPDMTLDTEISSGHKFDVSQEFLARLHDTNPPEISPEQLTPQGLDEAEQHALDSAVGDLNDQEIAVLYNGIDVGELPPASEVDSVSDLPVPETAEDRQKLAENLEALTDKTVKETPAEFTGEERSFWNDDWNEEAMIIGGGALLAAGLVGGGIWYDKKKNRRRRLRDAPNRPLPPEAFDRAAEIRLAAEERWRRDNPQPGMTAPPAPQPYNPNAQPPVPPIQNQRSTPQPLTHPKDDFEEWANDFLAGLEDGELDQQPDAFDDVLLDSVVKHKLAEKSDITDDSISQTETEFKQYLLDNSDKTFNKLYAQYEVEPAYSTEEYTENYEEAKKRFAKYIRENNDLYLPYPSEDDQEKAEFQEELNKLMVDFLKNKTQETPTESVTDQPVRRITLK